VNKDDKDDKDTFSVLIHEDVPIPTKSSEIYSTHENDQTEITVKIFNGSLETAARIGRFNLEDIPPAPKGKPRIKVTFDIDASCVLHVTAKDLDTGKSKSVKVEDSAVSA
jgi:molecular chaperone DnaK